MYLWKPNSDQVSSTLIWKFINKVNKDFSLSIQSFDDLYHWSIHESEKFWSSVWNFSGIQSSQFSDVIISNKTDMENSQFFPDSYLNYAENLLKKPLPNQAIVFWGENKVRRELTSVELIEQVKSVQNYLKHKGIQKGDRIAGCMPNLPETVIIMLATVSLGAIWTSCSPDFGVEGILDRFQQTTPKILFITDGYFYAGRWHNCIEKIEQAKPQLLSVKEIICIPYLGKFENSCSMTSFQEILKPYSTKDPLTFVQVPFNHPLYILYSSGTTGAPKCIIHGHGGTLIQHLKEHQLHCDIQPNDRVFYYTTCSWMMWNWLVSSLASGATLMLYDGSPFYPHNEVLFDYAAQEKFTHFGTSAKFIDHLRKNNLKPKDNYNLSNLKLITSTGSPLSVESFEYVYSSISSTACLASISGGTDIISCFALGNLISPVWAGELQGKGLGLKVEIFDDQGNSIEYQKGELVCTAPFPSMPLGFWNDPTRKKYHQAYFSRFKNIWYHGDYVEQTKHQGLIIYGRSDAVLNPGGIRIGTAEIYRQVEHVEEVLESMAIGQEIPNDSRVILFVHLKKNITLNPALIQKIKDQIRRNTTIHHVPAIIIQVNDLPRTRNGKIVEKTVTDLIHGRPIKNKEALANPESLSEFENMLTLKLN